ncbi:MAG TPA: PQQ-dependent sugar dehydrogenase, partial [Gemmatimonadaceae bacterium]|nr:PQQ-dependent sugar dehydrogenase [Gemmatimonadaceae bacterium]
IVFGPDGMLYIGMGDGGSGGDPQGNGQNLATLLGKLLRIDVDGGSPYAVPSTNPFVGQANARGEIWALGLRNPWRWSFDREAGQLYIGDVGQNAWEEVDVVAVNRAGVNYGWVTMEATHCYNATSCNQTGLELPVLEYDHGQGCSITGGFVYRGTAIPGIRGHYFYSDYCTGFLRSFRYAGGAATDQKTWSVGDPGSVLSFGEDSQGELYVLSASGTVYRLVSG